MDRFSTLMREGWCSTLQLSMSWIAYGENFIDLFVLGYYQCVLGMVSIRELILMYGNKVDTT